MYCLWGLPCIVCSLFNEVILVVIPSHILNKLQSMCMGSRNQPSAEQALDGVFLFSVSPHLVHLKREPVLANTLHLSKKSVRKPEEIIARNHR